ncbi:MAG: sodium-dependent transporter [Planctomycetes bacterium]|nr:sodium-dependent transporter [Planctomycetota bacterium]
MPRGRRETWGSRLGIIMAVAGSAVGLGNFLRFPGKVASNGGGAFMIPYFVCLLLMGIPLMWVEWAIGRYGGGFGHSTAPGAFHTLWRKNRFIKYFGLIGIFGPLTIFIYYTYVESWTLGYSIFSLTGEFAGIASQQGMREFLVGYQMLEHRTLGIPTAYLFFLATFGVNAFILWHGIRGGIERFCKIAMPILLVCGVIMAIRVLTLGTPDPDHPDWCVDRGLGFLWNPDFSVFSEPKRLATVWLEAAGQIFFTLSVGMGSILTYASYLSEGDDVALSGLSAVSMNEVTEVILGGSIGIVGAYVFFGPVEAGEIASGGVFDLGFVTMPLIINRLAASSFFGFIWFGLLFLAGITSSLSLAQPAVAFLEDEFDLSRRKAIAILGAIAFVLCHGPIFFLGNGVLDEMDFWGATVCLILFSLLEAILFAWVFGMDDAWEEMHRGAQLRIPRFYRFIMKYVTPVILIAILVGWAGANFRDVILMRACKPENYYYLLATRGVLLAMAVTLGVLIFLAWRRRRGVLPPGEDRPSPGEGDLPPEAGVLPPAEEL